MTESLAHYEPAAIRHLCEPGVFSHAQQLLGAGAVRSRLRQGTMLSAQVHEGSATYAPDVDLREHEPLGICDCPYDYPICPHVAAVLLAWWYQPESFIVETEPAETRGGLRAERGNLPAWARPTPAASRDAAKAEWHRLLEANYSLKQMRAIAQERGWRLRGTSKAQNAEQLADLLGDPAESAQVLAKLSRAELAALWALAILDDGQGATAESVGQAIQVLIGEPDQPGKRLNRLLERGLAIAQPSNWPAGTLYRFPPGLAARLPSPLAWAGAPARPPAGLPLQTPTGLSESLYHLWSAIQARQPAALRPGAEDWARTSWESAGRIYGYQEMIPVPPPAPPIAEDSLAEFLPLAGGDRTKLLFLWALLRDLQLVIVQRNQFIARPEAMAAFLALDSAEQRRLLVRTWLACLRWHELDGLLSAARDREGGLTLFRSAYPYGLSPQALRQELARRRRFVVRWLATLPDHTWSDLEAFLLGLRMLWESFHRCPPREINYGMSESWWLGWAERRLDYRRAEDWARGQGALVRGILTGPLHWLGLVALDQRAGLVCPLGLADIIWEREVEAPAAARPPTPPLVDEAGLTVTLQPGSGGARAYWMLERLGRLETISPGGALTYRLDREVAHRTFEQGATPGDLLAAWEESLSAPPEQIRQTLAGWWAGYAQVRLTEGVAVIETADEVTMRELLAIPALRQHILAQLGPCVAAVAPESVEPLLEAMIKKGYTPKRA